MRIWLFIFAFFNANLLLAGFIANRDPWGLELTCESAIMVDATTGHVIFAKDVDKKIHPGSTTKVITAIVAYRLLQNRLSEMVTITKDMVVAISPEKKRANIRKIPAHWLETASSHMGLKIGEIISVEDLFKGCLMVSANDASNALALAAAGSYKAFMEKANATLKELGCRNTHFMNTHGLYHPDHYSTVYDLMLMGRALMLEPQLRSIVCQKVYQRPKTNKQESTLMHNTNRLIAKNSTHYSKWVNGIKNGYTQDSGGTVIVSATNGARTICLVIWENTPLKKVYEDAQKLVEAAMTEPRSEKWFFKPGTLLEAKHAVSGASSAVEGVVKDGLKLQTYASERVNYKGSLHWLDLVPPVKKGQVVGRIDIISEQGQILASSQVVAAKDAEPTLGFKIRHWVSQNRFLSENGKGFFL